VQVSFPPAKMHGFTVCVTSALAGLVAGNYVNLGMGHCLDLKRSDMPDGTRQSLSDFEYDVKNGLSSVKLQMYRCHGDAPQHYHTEGGYFKSHFLPDKCLTYDDTAIDLGDGTGVTVSFEDCKCYHTTGGVETEVKCDTTTSAELPLDFAPTAHKQAWRLTKEGNVCVKGGLNKRWTGAFGAAPQTAAGTASTREYCLDVIGTSGSVLVDLRERDTADVYLVESSNALESMSRRWSWQPFQNGQFVTEAWQPTASATGSSQPCSETTDGAARAYCGTAKFSLHDLGLKVNTPATLALTIVAISLFVIGVAIGVHRASRFTALAVPLDPTE